MNRLKIFLKNNFKYLIVGKSVSCINGQWVSKLNNAFFVHIGAAYLTENQVL